MVFFVREEHPQWIPAWDYQWVEGPVAALQRRGVRAHAVSIQQARRTRGALIVTHGAVAAGRPNPFENFRAFLDRGPTVLFSCADWGGMDDDECRHLFGPPAQVRAAAHIYEQLAGAADAVAVGEIGLVEIFAPVNPRTVAVEWAAPESSQWPAVRPRHHAGLRIGWAGLDRLPRDFEMIRPALTRLARERGVQMVFMGLQPPWANELPRARFLPRAYVGPRDYFETLASLELDLAVAPIAETRFNATRSRSKFVDSTAGMGCPLVASDFGVYRRLATAGAPLVTVPNDPEAWDTALAALLDDPARRAALTASARTWVQDHATFAAVADQWLEAIHLAVQ